MQRTPPQGGVTPAQINQLNADVYAVGPNLINEANIIDNGFINNNTGGLASDGSYRYCPDYIELDPSKAYTFLLFGLDKVRSTTGAIIFAYYTAAKTYISGFIVYQSTLSASNYQLALTIPANAKYIRVSSDDSATHKLWMLKQASPSASAYYEPYKYGVSANIYPYRQGYEKLKNKVIVNFGDSQIGMSDTYTTVSAVLTQLTGATVHNVGFGGTQLSQHSESKYDAFSMYQLAYAIANNDYTVQDASMAANSATLPSYYATRLATLKAIDFNYAVDYITIGHGLNDFDADVVLENVADDDDTTKFAGALRYSLNLLIAAFPRIKILLCTPTYRYWQSEGVYTDDCRTHQNTIPLLLKDYADSIISVAAEYGLPYLDNLRTSGINYYNRSTYVSTDGVHYVAPGWRRMAEKKAAALISGY